MYRMRTPFLLSFFAAWLQIVGAQTSLSAVSIQDTSGNSPAFWNSTSWINPNTGLKDLEEAEIELQKTFADTCTGVQISYKLWLDLDGDGFQETVVVPDDPNVPAGFLKFNNPLSGGGELREFDQHSAILSEKYHFSIESTKDGSSYTVRAIWRNEATLPELVKPQLPPGRHFMIWQFKDSCHIVSLDTVRFDIIGSMPLGGFDGVAIRFPDDYLGADCQENLSAPTLLNVNHLPIKIAFEDMPLDIVPQFCKSFDRIWTVFDTATYKPNAAGVLVPNPSPNAISNSPFNKPGPLVGPAGLSAPWNPSLIKINPGDPSKTDFSTFWNKHANFYRYRQYIRIYDNKAPIIQNCPDNALFLPDTTANNPKLWHEDYWLNNATASNDLPERPANLGIQALDSCSGTNLNFRYLLFLDLNQDGQPETVVSSTNPGTPGTVRYNNINTPGYQGGEERRFDERNVLPDNLYTFGVTQTILNGLVHARTCWYTAANPGAPSGAQLPPGAHYIKWFVGDACGNEAPCEIQFTIPYDSIVGISAPLGKYMLAVMAQPNPFSSQTQLVFQLKKPQELQIQVYDLTGALVLSKKGTFSAGIQRVTVDWDGKKGVYYALVHGNEGAGSCKLVKTE